MSQRYKQSPVMTGVTRFTKAPMANVEFSRMVANPQWLLPFNAGDIVPVYYSEVLPHDTISLDLDFVIRQNTVKRPTMGKMDVDFYAFFVPNRIVNESWKNVQGENTSGYWSAPEVELAPLLRENYIYDIQVPVGSVADYYGFPTQMPIRDEVLKQMNDLKFKGYLAIYNQWFRDENYQNPIPFSKLNVYQGFFEPVGTWIGVKGYDQLTHNENFIPAGTEADGSYPDGAVVKALYGDGAESDNAIYPGARLTTWSALNPPLKANKLHDFITSGLPSPQKGAEVYFGVGEIANVVADTNEHSTVNNIKISSSFDTGNAKRGNVFISNNGTLIIDKNQYTDGVPGSPLLTVDNTNLVADLSNATGIDVNSLRTAIATQQVYEILARGGSRYTEIIRSMFGLETENPFSDIPTKLGHIRRELDLYQVAQTSASVEGETPQGELTAFGYTTSGGKLFTRTFLEHGYVHVFAVVRQRNTYSTYLAPDNFRKGTLDFYLPALANIGEQPIRLATLNPFAEDSMEKVIAYQEAWWEYRYEPDRVHGAFRTGLGAQGIGEVWTYADDFDYFFDHVNGEWLKSNAQEVMDRTLAVDSSQAPQLKGLFSWKVDKQRPMPTYSVPGLDTV